jgi:hypothetical protein
VTYLELFMIAEALHVLAGALDDGRLDMAIPYQPSQLRELADQVEAMAAAAPKPSPHPTDPANCRCSLELLDPEAVDVDRTVVHPAIMYCSHAYSEPGSPCASCGVDPADGPYHSPELRRGDG